MNKVLTLNIIKKLIFIIVNLTNNINNNNFNKLKIIEIELKKLFYNYNININKIDYIKTIELEFSFVNAILYLNFDIIKNINFNCIYIINFDGEIKHDLTNIIKIEEILKKHKNISNI